ncbi:MAG TPA: heme-copper oxidase subunit III [Pyrinomonadaceae bacterium]|nr:heme-copper oxidase subunit III [Pyrinomonadaceae bacterium]
MEVGTAEPVIDPEPVDKRQSRSRLSGSGSGRGNGSNGGGGDDDSGGPRSDNFSTSSTETPDKAKFVTWFLLLVVLMTFGGMIGAYIVISTNGAAEWQPFELPIQVWLSTVLIIASSITYHIAQNALFKDNFSRTRKFLIATTILGAAFIASQILVWMALVDRGFYMRGNPYAGFFYILTAAHVLHVIGGIIALGAVLLRVWIDTAYEPELVYRRNLTRSVGWYWHFIGALWLVLFGLLGFWK